MKRIAVIAVHGVADQQPSSSARSLASLLLNLDHQDSPVYTRFREFTQRLRTRPVDLVNRTQTSIEANPFDAFAAEEIERLKRDASKPPDRESDYAFLHGQLSGYPGEAADEPYETIRLEGERLSPDGSAAAAVHVYEMYWADLSRLGSKALRLFGDIFQIILHLARVGVHTLRAAHIANHGSKEWTRFVKTHAAAVWVLSGPIVILNLLLVALAFALATTAMIGARAPSTQIAIVWCLICIGALYFTCARRYRAEAPPNLAGPSLVAGLAVIAGVAGILGFGRDLGELPYVPAILSWAALLLSSAVSAFLLIKTLRSYNRYRPGALRRAKQAITVTLIAAVLSLAFKSPVDRSAWTPPDLLPYIYLARLFEVSWFVLSLSWASLFACAMAAHFAGERAVGKDQKETPGRRARWTARICLSISALSFTSLTLALWAAVSTAVTPLIPGAAVYRSLFFGSEYIAEFGLELLGQGSTRLVLLSAAFALLAIIVLLVAIAPSVWKEMNPPSRAASEEDAQSSDRLGRWLSAGYMTAKVAGALIYVLVVFLFPLGNLLMLIDLLPGHPLSSLPYVPAVLSALDSTGRNAIAYVGLAVAGSAVGFITLGRMLQRFAKYLAPFDAVLDVDNYMREHPRESNPTARIFARYASLLRHISTWRDTVSNERYDAIVIVAHSQGSVITADLLRFLNTELTLANGGYEPDLNRIFSKQLPIYLFTMGCPLRQLYGRRFPHLYDWTYHDVNNPMDDWKLDDLQPARTPDPAKLGVQSWVNAFRSGDYIGRYLWRGDLCKYLWLFPVSADEKREYRPWDIAADMQKFVSSNTRDQREFCIGAGAHTHYWDRTAPEIAVELDRLIQEAASSMAGAVRTS